MIAASPSTEGAETKAHQESVPDFLANAVEKPPKGTHPILKRTHPYSSSDDGHRRKETVVAD